MPFNPLLYPRPPKIYAFLPPLPPFPLTTLQSFFSINFLNSSLLIEPYFLCDLEKPSFILSFFQISLRPNELPPRFSPLHPHQLFKLTFKDGFGQIYFQRPNEFTWVQLRPRRFSPIEGLRSVPIAHPDGLPQVPPHNSRPPKFGFFTLFQNPTPCN